MDNKIIENLIRRLGSSYKVLVAENLIGQDEPKSHYIDSDTKEIFIDPNIELVFWAENLRFEMIVVKAGKLNNIKEELPTALNILKNTTDVRRDLGEPMFTKSELELYGTEFYGWDTYQLPISLHPEALLDIQYDKNKKISNIIISLMDKNS
jgi:hypothetical protein